MCPDHKHFPDIIIIPLLLLVAYRDTDRHTGRLVTVCVFIHSRLLAGDAANLLQVFADECFTTGQDWNVPLRHIDIIIT